MPMHDWTRVEPGIFHAFHHEWISEISRTLNQGLLPDAYYALPEQVAAGFGPDVLTLQEEPADANPRRENVSGPQGTTVLQTRPRTTFTAETDAEFYRRKKSSIAIRHISGDHIVAMLEIVSPGNKSNRHAFRALVEKACELLEHRIHLLIVDPFPPQRAGSQRHSRRDLGACPGGSFSSRRRPAADFGGLRMRSHHESLHRNRRRGPTPARHAVVSGTERLRHGSLGSHVSSRVFQPAETLAKRPLAFRPVLIGGTFRGQCQPAEIKSERFSCPAAILTYLCL
jgi:hypothetical protein